MTPPDRRSRLEKAAMIYFGLQALLTLAGWALLLLLPSSRRFFIPIGLNDLGLLSFCLADLIFFVIGSAGLALAIWRQRPWLFLMLWFVAGGVLYATLYTFGLTLLMRAPLLSPALMLAASAGTLFFTFLLQPPRRPRRVETQASS